VNAHGVECPCGWTATIRTKPGATVDEIQAGLEVMRAGCLEHGLECDAAGSAVAFTLDADGNRINQTEFEE
jgi:hypothetical protein